MAVEVNGKARADVFLAKASEAFGGSPATTRMGFATAEGTSSVMRDVATWRSPDSAAFIWRSNSLPVLLLWSTAAMNRRASDYQTTLDAPAVAAGLKEKADEAGTKF